MLHPSGAKYPRTVVIIEASEESGSPDLPAYIEHLKERIGMHLSYHVPAYLFFQERTVMVKEEEEEKTKATTISPQATYRW